jgi:hypothetical protein
MYGSAITYSDIVIRLWARRRRNLGSIPNKASRYNLGTQYGISPAVKRPIRDDDLNPLSKLRMNGAIPPLFMLAWLPKR